MASITVELSFIWHLITPLGMLINFFSTLKLVTFCHVYDRDYNLYHNDNDNIINDNYHFSVVNN